MNGRELVQEFVKRRERHLPKSPLSPMWGRDAKILLQMKADLGEAELFMRMEAYFEDRGDWVASKGWNIPIFKHKNAEYDKSISSQARALAETREKRKLMVESPKREASVSEPHSLESLIKQLMRKIE